MADIDRRTTLRSALLLIVFTGPVLLAVVTGRAARAADHRYGRRPADP
jgi:hypothetical protein